MAIKICYRGLFYYEDKYLTDGGSRGRNARISTMVSLPACGFESYAVIGRILIANFRVFFRPRNYHPPAACTRASKLPTITGPPMKRRVNLRMNDADERTIRQR